MTATRRSLLRSASAAAAALALPRVTPAATTITTYSDNDLFNFALNLEYLEANFYYLAAFGTTIDVANAASTAAGAPVLTITGAGTQGTVSVKSSPRVPFATTSIGSYAVSIALDEGRHVAALRSVLGSAAVAQPALDLNAAFNAAASAAGLGATFDPFASETNFLLAAYLFEDVGVTAYHGALPLFSTFSNGRTYINAASGILATEAQHAGIVRSTLNALDPTNTAGLLTATQKISAARASLSLAALSTAPNPDDIPLTPGTNTVSLAGAAATTSTTLVNADPSSVVAFSRNATQILNIVTLGNAVTAGTPAKGGFFPAGLNGLFT